MFATTHLSPVARRRLRTRLAAVTAAIALSATATIATATAAGATPPTSAPREFRTENAGCAVAAGTRAHCFARFRVPVSTPGSSRRTGHVAGAAALVTAPDGLGPADISAAYGLPASTGTSHPVVAIVDAYDDPNVESDLAAYRRYYGLPACTTAGGCLRKVNQRGATGPYPSADSGWATEISLDVDAVSATCPDCRILLVEADSSTFDDLAVAVDTAVRLGAKVVSNSYGASEYNGSLALASHYARPGVSMVASSGDSGFGPASVPAAYPTVIAAGGTTLTRAASTARGWRESAWSGAGSGCSAYVDKPAWQTDTHCPMRTVADISALADPATGLAIYDTYATDEQGFDPGFVTFGGTSLSSPVIAAMIARSGRFLSDARYIYAHTGALYDPTGGSNGYCGGDYLCTGKKGYDAPTGAGSPHGLGAL